jgi:hypothetical protein
MQLAGFDCWCYWRSLFCLLFNVWTFTFGLLTVGTLEKSKYRNTQLFDKCIFFQSAQVEEKIEDTKEVIRNCNLKKDRQYNDKKKKGKTKYNGRHITTNKTSVWTTRAPIVAPVVVVLLKLR